MVVSSLTYSILVRVLAAQKRSNASMCVTEDWKEGSPYRLLEGGGTLEKSRWKSENVLLSVNEALYPEIYLPTSVAHVTSHLTISRRRQFKVDSVIRITYKNSITICFGRLV